MHFQRLCLWVALTGLLAGCALSAHAELTLSKVWPTKVFCQPGETNTLEIEVSNPDTTAASARLKVELVHELDAVVTLRDEPISVEAEKTVAWSLPWKAEPWLGIEVRATLSRDGKTLATKSDYFTCARTVHQVLISTGLPLCMGAVDNTLDDTIKSTVGAARARYANWAEQFSWAPSDYDDFTPDTDRYFAGQSQYSESTSNLLAMYRVLRANGVRYITYGKAGGGGFYTFEFLRKHPEYAVYGGGHPAGGLYDSADLDYAEAIGGPKPGDTRAVIDKPEVMAKAGYATAEKFIPFVTDVQIWSDLWYDGANDGVIRHISREMGTSAKTLGFSGVRFDGEFYATRFQRFDGSYNLPEKANLDEEDRRSVRNMKQWTWDISPGYLFGYNTHVDLRWNIASNSVPLAFQEKCKDDGLIVQEEMAFPAGVAWPDFVNTVKHHADMVRHYGGHYATIPFMRDPSVLYCSIIPYALRAHSHFYTNTNLPIGPFATRLASFLWDDSVHGWSGAGDAFTVTPQWPKVEEEANLDLKEPAPEDTTKDEPKPVQEVWWKPFSAVRPAPGGGTYIILHLVNAPRGKNTPTVAPTTPTGRKDFYDNALPAVPATTVEVRWTKPANFRRAMLADLDRNDLQPITPHTEGNALVFTTPEVAHWSVLILETGLPTPPEEITTYAGDTTAKNPNAVDLGLAPAAVTTDWRAISPAADAGWGNGVSDLVKDTATRGGWAVHAAPGSKAWLMAVGGYAYPPFPGKYTATFRLKVADNTSDKPVANLGIEFDHYPTVAGKMPLPRPNLVVKGTDFAKPNVYQQFTLAFERPDGGFIAPLCAYAGNGELWWDQTDLKLEEHWKTEDFERYYAALAPPDDLQKPSHPELNALVLRGPWNRLYQLDAALLQLGPVNAATGYIRWGAQEGTRVLGYTMDWPSLYQQDLLVLANANVGGLGYGIGKMIRQWVKDGGSLVLLGGMHTLGQAGCMQYGWEEFLPVTLNLPYEIRKCDPPVAFGKLAKGITPIDFGKTPPVVLYRHAVTAKPNTTVLLAGKNNEPLLVAGAYGKGRVVVFTGTVLGEAPAGQTPFWQSPAWPQLLAATLDWCREGAKK
ncbi:MAG: glutamine amidotransferase [Armatimonadota bacterium]